MIKNTALIAGFALCVPAANWLIGNVGNCIPNGPCLIPVGFGLSAPSGVLLIGLALVLRDAVHESLGAKWAALAIIAGVILTYLTADPFLATASAVAFLIAEVFDMAVYTPLRKRSMATAVLLSGAVGAAVDSIAFTFIAFGSVDLALGTFIGKIYASALYAAWKARAALAKLAGEA